MPVALSYPGVYIQEIPSGVRTITGVATSITAFIGRAARGLVNEPVAINNFGDFERQFGGLGVNYPLPYAVRDFYLNGGSQALIVRLYKNPSNAADARATLTIDGFALEAKSPGTWGKKLRAAIDVEVASEARTRLGLAATDALFNLTVRYGNATERFLNLNFKDNARRIDRVLLSESSLVNFKGNISNSPPAMHKVTEALTKMAALSTALAASPVVAETVKAAQKDYDAAKLALADTVSQKEQALADAVAKKDTAGITTAEAELKSAEDAMKGDDGGALEPSDYESSKSDKTGLYALDKADLFNLLCIPPDIRDGDTSESVYQIAMAYCQERRAMLLVDSPSGWEANPANAAANAKAGLSALALAGEAARNAALYFPRVLKTDPLRAGQLDTFVPCGIIAGIMARTDSTRGVWKAPAGLDAALNGIQGLSVNLTDAENGMLNPLGINCLRSFPVNGRVVWGSRTLRGADQLADEWKYIPVRRTALFIEESLYRGTQWVVFEPNDEPLWSQIRLNIGAFMHSLFRQGAFQGTSPKDAYFVKCDKETTTQDDINRGIVNIHVGFAPLKPAEFVVISIQQMAGQIQV